MSSIPAAQIVDGRKTFIPLENNPEVLSHLCRNLGISRDLAFHDVLSTCPELLAWVPRPVYALILLADRPIYNAARSAIEPTVPEYHGSGPDEPVMWMRQTIGHACGLMALLHSVWNLEGGQHVPTGSRLDALFKQAVELGPAERAQLLYDSKFLEEAHMDAASRGSSIAPSPQDDNHHHFVAFVVRDGQVWELNGGLNGPLQRGTLTGEDLLSERGLAMTVQDFLDAAEKGGHEGMSIVAVAGPEAALPRGELAWQ
ncbi:ubiquitin carboxyl-terminal hydrolase isozyme L3 [Penicillium canariense]|uniref:Ubiquitin carboxyl-terminal hydrolase n=1 Tax=Penicillium canariense TaxID=189055 RepID=A0A9W9I050_9EURO|nr:ubiquitin carboxyl-terminal hydrolase isozyme L3 [Penicillium canariense]KAJ5160662.1 ubiquitin carboxyl-terminal hydrolase isozyme L3 [Penicillium canariense]